MTIKTLDAVLAICEYSHWEVSNMRMQKVLYLSHKVFFWRNNCNPLIKINFQAWDYGPVVPDVYHEFKMFGADPIENIFWTRKASLPNSDTGESKLIKEACDSLSSLENWQLVAMTHRKGGAWKKHYTGEKGVVIPNESIYKEYLGEKSERENSPSKQ